MLNFTQICYSENCLWQQHLQGARDLILFRGGPSCSSYLDRFFSLLDVSGSLFAGGGTLLKGKFDVLGIKFSISDDLRLIHTWVIVSRTPKTYLMRHD